MHLGILRTDSVRSDWVGTYGEYPDMFECLLRAQDPTLTFTTWDAEAGALPDRTDEADGYLITGSKSSVYDDKDWIRALEDFVRILHAERRKLIGICFGHQLVAQALGGSVAKSPKGWGVGIQCYELCFNSFELSKNDSFCLLASHQDQVLAMPPGARAIATSAHCEIAGMTIGEHVLTFQGHPEFTVDYSRELITFRREMIGDHAAEQGLASLDSRIHEGDRIAGWMLAFLG